MEPNGIYKVYRFKFVLFGSVSSPFILNAVVKTHLDNHPSPVTIDFLSNTYTDNVISGTDTETDAIAYYGESTELNRRCWSTNCSTLQSIANNDNNLDSSTLMKICWYDMAAKN